MSGLQESGSNLFCATLRSRLVASFGLVSCTNVAATGAKPLRRVRTDVLQLFLSCPMSPLPFRIGFKVMLRFHSADFGFPSTSFRVLPSSASLPPPLTSSPPFAHDMAATQLSLLGLIPLELHSALIERLTGQTERAEAYSLDEELYIRASLRRPAHPLRSLLDADRWDARVGGESATPTDDNVLRLRALRTVSNGNKTVWCVRSLRP